MIEVGAGAICVIINILKYLVDMLHVIFSIHVELYTFVTYRIMTDVLNSFGSFECNDFTVVYV